MNDAQREAIANANAHVSDAGMPTYIDLAEKLRHIERWMSGYGTKTQVEMREEVRALIDRIPTE